MHWYTYIFPALTAVFILAFFFACPPIKSAELSVPSRDNYLFGRRDISAIVIICAVYSAVAFFALGNRVSPESFCHFQSRGQYADIDLGEQTDVGGIRYFAGINSGTYYVQFSDDGESFTDVGTMSQTYSDIFKWREAEFNEDAAMSARCIRIIAGSDLYLGELAVLSSDGEIMSADSMTYDAGTGLLLDEQTVVPEAMTYMNSSYFDEVYHARTAYENLLGVYPYEVSHPPLGKLIIALGIEMLGINPFGWRFMGTLFGVLMLPALYYLLKRLFGGVAVPACATIVFAFDFMHYVQTRIATIDTYAVFFIILMYLFMYLYITTDSRRHLALSGLFFGLGAASKWTCLYAGAGLGVIWLIYRIVNFKRLGLRDFIKNCLFCLVFFVALPCLIYYLSYYPYGTASGLEGGVGMYFKKEYADIVIKNQSFMFNYHEGVNSEHPYSSRWYQWVFNIRPILYYLQYPSQGRVSTFGAFLNPLLCWGGLVAMFSMVYLTLFRRDGRAGFILVGYLAQLLPWVFISRTTFEYHYFACTVFLVSAIAYIFDIMLRDSRRGRMAVYIFTGASVGLFVMFYPVLSGLEVSSALADAVLGWLPTWPF